MKLSICMATYDRFIPYLRCLRSIKPAIHKGSDICLNIRVDSKLNWIFYIIKLILTKIVLGKSQYTYAWGKECIGLTRDQLVNESDSEYFMNFDDDDLLNSSNLIRLLKVIPDYDILAYEYYGTGVDIRISVYKRFNWIPKYWFDNNDLGLSVGQSAIFKRSLYLKLPKKWKYFRSNIDEVLSNNIMFYEAKLIGKVDIEICKRNRGENSLVNQGDINKLWNLVETLEEFHEYLNINSFDYGEGKSNLIWKLTLSNHLEYHKRKSGVKFFKLSHAAFGYQNLWKYE